MSERPAKKICDSVILFNRMNTDLLLGQMKSIVENNTQIKVLAQEETERI